MISCSVRSVIDLGEAMALCTVAWQDFIFEATIVGGVPSVGETVRGELDLEQIMACRAAREDQNLGLSQGPGFWLCVGTVSRRFDYGSSDLRFANESVMIDDEDLPTTAPTLGDTLSIGFKEATLTIF